MPLFNLTKYLSAGLCLVCLAGVGQAGAVDAIQDDFAVTQEISSTPQGGVSVKQVIKGWGLQEVGVTDTSSLWDSFKGFKGTACVSQSAGSLNNVFSLVNMNQGTGNATPAPSPILSKSLADNVLLNYSSTYSTVIGGGSFSGSHGIAAVTQVAGNMNNVTNIVRFNSGGAPSSAAALSNASLSEVSASNNVFKNYGVSKASAEIQTDSFKGFSGVGSVIQASGSMIQISSRVTVNVNQ
jgi:hypothetical protein